MFKNSCLNVADNSGALLVKVTRRHRAATNILGTAASVVMRKYDVNRRLQKKKKYACLFITAKYQNRRQNGTCVRFGENRGLLFSDFNFEKLIGTHVSGPAGRELRKRQYDSATFQKISTNCIIF